MNKEDLAKLRTLKATPKMMKMAAVDTPRDEKNMYFRGYQYGMYMRCQTLKGILKVAFFLPDHMRMGGNMPAYELFISSACGQFITYDWQQDKWATAKLDRLTWPGYVYGSNKKWINPEGYATIKSYLGVSRGGYEGILDYQRNIREKELKKRHKRETDPWDADLAQIPELPKDWERWSSKVGVPENYIFYEYSRKGADTGYCTFCEKDVPIKAPRHNKQGVCPCCRHKIQYKSVGKAGTVRTEQAYMYLMQRCRDGFVVREFRGVRRYLKGEYKTAECCNWEIRRSIYNGNAKALRSYDWGDYKQCKFRWIRTNPCNPTWSGNDCGRIYGKTLPDLAKKELKCTGLPEQISSNGVVDPEKYLAVLQEVPLLEKLAKANLPCLVEECISPYCSFKNKIQNPNAHSLSKMLGIDNQSLKRLRKNHGGSRFLAWLQYEKVSGKTLPDSVISWFSSEKIELKDLKFISGKMSMVQICNYMKRQMEESQMKSEELLRTWSDYLSMAKRLKMDTNDEIIFRVKKLRQRHDELVLQCEQKEIAIQAGEILEDFPHVDEVCQMLKEKYEFADKDYTVLAPTCVEDIIMEGRNLTHCVGKVDHYWNRINRREAFVMFLRKTKEVDKPYYTLEIEPDGTVRQKRTKFDRQEKDIDAATKFLKKWQKNVAKRLTPEDMELAEKSRILRNQEFTKLRKDRVIIHTGHLAGKLLVDVLLADLLENNETTQSAAKAA